MNIQELSAQNINAKSQGPKVKRTIKNPKRTTIYLKTGYKSMFLFELVTFHEGMDIYFLHFGSP